MVLACVLFCVSCASAPAEQPADAEDTAKAFLTAFYTADEEDRYTEFLSATEGASSDETLDAAADAYHASLAELSTEEVVETLAQNRTLSQYDAAHAGQDVQVQGNHATLVSDGSLAGSVTTLPDCVRTAVRDMDIPLETAIACATINPAISLGEEADYGSLAPGKKADIVLWDENLELKKVIKDGCVIR